MYNLNINVSAAGTAVNNLLAVESACTTPRTPEILNSLIAMTNPLDSYNFGTEAAQKAGGSCPQNISNDSNSSCSTQGDNTTSPPSIQHTCSQLIKAGLKLSIESKRKYSADTDDLLDLDLNAKRVRKSECDDDDIDGSLSPNQGLTPEDEERRRRRRERNKIAATKCRLKKREKTVNLVQESEILETQNIDLKSQIQELESQRRRLVDMLTMHTPSCMKHQATGEQHFSQPRDARFLVADDDQNYGADGPLPPVTSLATSVIETNHAYNRPASVDIGPTFRNQGLEFCNRPASVAIAENTGYTARPNNSGPYPKPPAILIDGESYSPPAQLTNLDNTAVSYHYNTQQCHNYNSPNSTNQNQYASSTMDNGCMA